MHWRITKEGNKLRATNMLLRTDTPEEKYIISLSACFCSNRRGVWHYRRRLFSRAPWALLEYAGQLLCETLQVTQKLKWFWGKLTLTQRPTNKIYTIHELLGETINCLPQWANSMWLSVRDSLAVNWHSFYVYFRMTDFYYSRCWCLLGKCCYWLRQQVLLLPIIASDVPMACIKIHVILTLSVHWNLVDLNTHQHNAAK